MKHLDTLVLALVIGSFSAPAHGQAGELDSTFHADGLVSTDIAFGSYDDANAVIMQPDGAILAGGTSGFSGTQDFAVVRYLTNGVLDAGFGLNGQAVLSMDFGDDILTALALQADGKILAGGYVYSSMGICFGIARFHTDGTPDSTFGGTGAVLTNFIDTTVQGRAVAVQDDGKILLAGGGSAGFAVVRYHDDGSLDSTFGVNGLVTCSFSDANDMPGGMAIQPDGKIVVGGYASGLVGDSIAIARFDANGVLDPGFGIGGKVKAAMPLLNTLGRAMALMPDGRIVVAGSAATDAVVARFTSDGILDNSFNAFGLRTISLPAMVPSNAYGVAVQVDGKIVVAGLANQTSTDFLLARLNDDGSYDMNFDGDGIVTTDFNGVFDAARAMTLQDDGAIVLAGATNGGIQDYNFALARYKSGLSVGVEAPVITDGSLVVYPQPLSVGSVLQYTLASDDLISIDLYDARGVLVQQVLDRQLRQAGAHVEELGISSSLAPGLYALALRGRAMELTVKVVR